VLDCNTLLKINGLSWKLDGFREFDWKASRCAIQVLKCGHILCNDCYKQAIKGPNRGCPFRDDPVMAKMGRSQTLRALARLYQEVAGIVELLNAFQENEPSVAVPAPSLEV
jgi:hypothetical protein